MANVSFEKKSVETPVEGVTIDVETTSCPAENSAPAAEIPTRPAPCTAVAARSDSPHAIFDDNNIGFEDIIVPRLNIVQKVGELSNVFPGGAIVLDQSQILYQLPQQAQPGQPAPSPATPLNIVVIGFKATTFVEKVEGGGLGLVCRTRDEVHAKGGTLDYKEWEDSKRANKENPSNKVLRRFDYMTTALVLVEKPERIQDPNQNLFPYPCDGKFYALTFMTFKSSAYTAGAKTIFTHKKTRLFTNPKASFSDTYFFLGSELKAFKGGTFAYIPVVEGGPKVSEAMATLVNNIKGNG